MIWHIWLCNQRITDHETNVLQKLGQISAMVRWLKKYDHYDIVAVYRMVKSFWRSCQASRCPILRHHHPLTWKHKHEKGWLFKWKFFNHQHLTFINIVTFLPSEFLTKSRNNPTKLQVTCPSWLWLCASIMQSIL